MIDLDTGNGNINGNYHVIQEESFPFYVVAAIYM